MWDSEDNVEAYFHKKKEEIIWNTVFVATVQIVLVLAIVGLISYVMAKLHMAQESIATIGWLGVILIGFIILSDHLLMFNNFKEAMDEKERIVRKMKANIELKNAKEIEDFRERCQIVAKCQRIVKTHDKGVYNAIAQEIQNARQKRA